MENKKVVIIGAGFSGIAAGVKLLESGISDVVILEAENRIGGRVHSIEFGEGKKIDMGAQWVQGQAGNVIYEMTKDHVDFTSTTFRFEPSCFFSNGELADQDQCMKLMALSEMILENVDEMKNFNGSLGEFFDQQYEIALNSDDYKDVDRKLAYMVRNVIESQQNGYFASTSWFDISAKLCAKYPNAEGDQLQSWQDKGYISAVDYITVSKYDLKYLL